MIQYHISRNGASLGVFPEDAVGTMLAAGTIHEGDLCWCDGMEGWRPVFEVLARPDPLRVPPPLPVAPAAPSLSHGTSPPPPVRAVPRMGDDAGMRMLLPVGRSGWAIAAGYLGLFSLMILPAPIALLVSIIAIRDINKSARTDQPKYGMGRAVFGLIMGILGTGLMLIMIALEVLRRR